MTSEIESTAVEDSEPTERHDLVPIAKTPGVAVTPQVSATDLVARLDVIREAADKAMQRDVDFGIIPGTDKPTLYKPGAEKLGVLFQLDIQITNEKVWGPDDHLTVMSLATVFHAPSGVRLGFGEGMCSTRERKYAYRKQERTCPTCGASAVIKGKAEYGGGWLCWKKRDGCGAKFGEGSPAIESQPVGEIPNPDLPDLWNTVVKMAEKRARIDAVLAVTGASALFTQDMDDAATPSDAPEAAASADEPVQHQRLSKEQYKAITDGFAAAGSPFDEFLGELDRLGTAKHAIVGERVATLTPAKADELLAWLAAHGGESDLPWSKDFAPAPATPQTELIGSDLVR